MKTVSLNLILLVLCTVTAMATPTGYLAGSISLPATPDTESGVFTVDSNNLLYLGHAASKKTLEDIKSAKGSSSEIWTYDTVGGTYTQFYDSPGTNPSMNSVAGIWIDESTSPWTYYLADQAPDPGNPYTTGAVWRAQDNNGDGDIMDPGDLVELLTTDITGIIYVSDIIRNDATGEIYVTNAEGTLGNPMVFRLSDDDTSGYIETGEMYAYYNLENSFAFAGGLTFGVTTDEIFTHDSTGSIFRLNDSNGDGDALDTGEATLFATLPIAGAYDVEMDPDGDLFVTASDWGTTTHSVYEVTTDATPMVTLFEDLTPSVGSTGNFTFGNGAHFEASPTSPGAVLYMNYTTAAWGDPHEILTWEGEASGPIEAPSMSTLGMVILLTVLGTLLIRRK